MQRLDFGPEPRPKRSLEVLPARVVDSTPSVQGVESAAELPLPLLGQTWATYRKSCKLTWRHGMKYTKSTTARDLAVRAPPRADGPVHPTYYHGTTSYSKHQRALLRRHLDL